MQLLASDVARAVFAWARSAFCWKILVTVFAALLPPYSHCSRHLTVAEVVMMCGIRVLKDR